MKECLKKFILPVSVLLCLLVFGACESIGLESGGIDENPLVSPRAVQITALDKSLMANWSRVAAAQQYDPTYEIYYGTSPNPEQAAYWGPTEHDHTNLVSVIIKELENDVVYYVWVKAVYGELGASNYSPMTYGIPVPPPLEPNPSAEGGEGFLQVSWEADPHAYFYELQYKEGSYSDLTPAPGAEKTMTAESPVLVNGVETGGLIIAGLNAADYTVWVKASNTAGDSDYALITGAPISNELSAPNVPEIVGEVLPGNRKLTLTWQASARAAGYKLFYNTSNDFSSATLYSDSVAPFFGRVREELILPAGANGKTYYVWVKARNSQGDSAESLSVKGEPDAPKPINFNDVDFELGKAQAEYIFSEVNPPCYPPGLFNTAGELWDRLTRRKETALGNLFCDGAAWYARTKHNETFDFVFLNGGYLDQPLGRGAITVGAIESIPPPAARDDFYTIITLKGPELKMLLDQVSKIRNMGRGGKNTGGWGMVSREMRYTIQYPARYSSTNYEVFFYGWIKEGSVTLNGNAPDYSESATYRICTANYLASGGDGYTAFVIAVRDYPEIANVRNIMVPVWQGVCEYIYDKGSVTPYTDGRVKQLGGGVMCETDS